MFSPHKVQDLAPTMKQLKCFKCDKLEKTEDELISHMESKHIQRQQTPPTNNKNSISSAHITLPKLFSKNTREITAIIGDSITHNINTAEGPGH